MTDFTLELTPNGPRQDPATEWFPTPAPVTRAILDLIPIPKGGSVVEPCCGTGEMLEVLLACGFQAGGMEIDEARCSEAMKRGLPVCYGDFLHELSRPMLTLAGLKDAVVANPPFSLVVEFVLASLAIIKAGGYVAMLAPAEYIAGVERYQALYVPGSGFQSYNVLVRRVWAHAKAMAWFVWQKGYTGPWSGRHLEA